MRFREAQTVSTTLDDLKSLGIQGLHMLGLLLPQEVSHDWSHTLLFDMHICLNTIYTLSGVVSRFQDLDSGWSGVSGS